MWLVAVDPQQASDHPLSIDWSPAHYQDAKRWDLDYRLFSHYDIRERMLDWISYTSVAPSGESIGFMAGVPSTTTVSAAPPAVGTR